MVPQRQHLEQVLGYLEVKNKLLGFLDSDTVEYNVQVNTVWAGLSFNKPKKWAYQFEREHFPLMVQQHQDLQQVLWYLEVKNEFLGFLDWDTVEYKVQEYTVWAELSLNKPKKCSYHFGREQLPDGSTTGTPSTGTGVSRSEEQTPKLLGLRHYWIQSKSKHSIY